MKNITSRESFLSKVYEYSQGIEDYIGLVDYTMLNMDVEVSDIRELCERAKEYGVATVCVRPQMVKVAKICLKDSSVGITTVISFPEGTDSLESKIVETKLAIYDGADDIDMVLNYQELIKNENLIPYDELENAEDEVPVDFIDDLIQEVVELVSICHDSNKILKVIVESGRLNPKLTKIAAQICVEAGADFIKTSTGMVEVGAELDKIKIFYDIIKENNSGMLIKASGGIRTIEDIKRFSQYADRFGVGSGSIDNMMGEGDGESTY